MKILTWNCTGAFRKQFELLNEFSADILIIQECENPETSKDNNYKTWATNYIWTGEMANVIFFDNKPASKNPWTKEVWVYDYRTNIHHTLKKNPLNIDVLKDFIACYVKLFEAQKVRTHWDEDKELWYFSIIDVIQILTGSNNPRRYWNDLKRKLEQEGFSQLYDIIVQPKLESSDGKKYLTDCTDTQGILRIIQSIPSPKAEPFMQWLAQVGYERIEEDANPELSFDIITKAWSGKSVKQYKKHKKLKNENLRDHMTNMELVLNMLAEVSTTAISTQRKPTSLDESKVIAQQGGTIAGNARKQIEAKTGKKLVSKLNAKRIEGGKPKRNKLK